MGTWGTGLMESDHVLDWFSSAIEKISTKEKDEFKGVVVFTKTSFSKNFSKRQCK